MTGTSALFYLPFVTLSVIWAVCVADLIRTESEIRAEPVPVRNR